MSESVPLSQDEVERLAEAAIRQFFIKIGVDVTTSKALLEMQADFAFMRRNRVTAEKFREHAAKVTIGAVILGLVSWVATMVAWKGHP